MNITKLNYIDDYTNKKLELPLIKYTEEEILKEFNKLSNLKIDIMNQSVCGNKCSNNFFQQYRFETKKKNKSFINVWEDANLRSKLIIACGKLYKYKLPINISMIQSAYRHRYGSINQFKPYVASYIYQKFKPKRILDFSSGWGDRLIAAMANDIDYIGIDSNTNLKEPYKKMINFFHKHSKSKIKIIFEKSENIDYSKLPTYDLIFTSPPYYDIEIYQNMPQYENYFEWFNEFLEKIIFNSIKYLSLSGYMVLNIPITIYNDLTTIIGPSLEQIKLPLRSFKRVYDTKNKNKYYEYLYVWSAVDLKKYHIK